MAANDDWISTVTPGKTPVRGGPEVAYDSFRIIYGYWPQLFDNGFVTHALSGVQGYHPWSDPSSGKWIRIFDGDGKASLDCSGGRGYALAGQCVNLWDFQFNNTKCPVCVGNPTLPIFGTKIERHVDFSTEGADPLKFERIYARRGKGYWRNGNISAVGGSWLSNFDARATPNNTTIASATSVMVTLPSGEDLLYIKSGSTWAVASYALSGTTLVSVANRKGVPEKLAVVGSTYELTLQDDTVYVFNNTGRLDQIRYRGGYTQTVTYDSRGLRQTVSDNRSRSLTFTYNTQGLMTQMTTPGGVYLYTYALRGGAPPIRRKVLIEAPPTLPISG